MYNPFSGPTINDLIKSYQNTNKQYNTKNNQGITNVPALKNNKNKKLKGYKNQIKKLVNANTRKGPKGKGLAQRNNVQVILNGTRGDNPGWCNTIRLKEQRGQRLSFAEHSKLAGCKFGAGAKYYSAQARNQTIAGTKYARKQTVAGAKYVAGKARNVARDARNKTIAAGAATRRFAKRRFNNAKHGATVVKNKVKRVRNYSSGLKQNIGKTMEFYKKQRANTKTLQKQQRRNQKGAKIVKSVFNKNRADRTEAMVSTGAHKWRNAARAGAKANNQIMRNAQQKILNSRKQRQNARNLGSHVLSGRY